MSHKATVIKVLVFSAIGILLTIGLGAKLANSRLFADTYVLQAEFENAAGVLRGDAVKLAGVDVGRVERAEIENGRAIVTFNIDRDLELPTDSMVSLRWRNVLGQRFLYVHPGDARDTFEEDARIPVSNTQDVSDIGEFLNRLGPILKAIHPQQANAFLDAVNTAIAGNEAGVRRLLTDGATLARTLGTEDDQIRALLSSADEIMATYAEQDDAIGEIFDNLDDVGEMLARRTDDVNSLVTDFAVVQDELDKLLRRSRGNIDSSISSLDTVAGTLARHRKDLSRTLRTLPRGSANYFQTSSWGEWFNVRIVALVFQDPDSNVLVNQREAENQRDPGDEEDDAGSQQVSGGEGHDAANSGPEGVEAVLRFVLSGAGS